MKIPRNVMEENSTVIQKAVILFTQIKSMKDNVSLVLTKALVAILHTWYSSVPSES